MQYLFAVKQNHCNVQKLPAQRTIINLLVCFLFGETGRSSFPCPVLKNKALHYSQIRLYSMFEKSIQGPEKKQVGFFPSITYNYKIFSFPVFHSLCIQLVYLYIFSIYVRYGFLSSKSSFITFNYFTATDIVAEFHVMSSIFSLELDDKYTILFCMCSSLLYLISEIQWAKINMSFNVQNTASSNSLREISSI